jgi:hypothetical protein
MTNSAGAVQNGFVLRLSVPTSGEMSNLGPELATRLAEQLGVKPARSTHVAGAMADLAQQVNSSAALVVHFEFHKHDAQLKIVARCDERTAETRILLSA